MQPILSVRAQHARQRGISNRVLNLSRRDNAKKSRTYAVLPGVTRRRRELLESISMRKNHVQDFDDPGPWVDISLHGDTIKPGSSMQPSCDSRKTPSDATYGESDLPPMVPEGQTSPSKAAKRRILPDDEANRLYSRWSELIPVLSDSLLAYQSSSASQVICPAGNLSTECLRQSCPRKSAKLTCLYFDHFRSILVTSCACQNQGQLLVKNGLFPTAPSQPRMAISTDLLEFYRRLFEHSPDAVSASAAGLRDFYGCRGFDVIDGNGEDVRDPFRRGLNSALQWYDILRTRIERSLDTAIEEADEQVKNYNTQLATTDSKSFTSAKTILEETRSRKNESHTICDAPDSGPTPTPLTPGACARILRQRCPACFGGNKFGAPFDRGGDCHVGVDGNFNHCHNKSAGTSPRFYDPEYFLPKSQIDLVGERIEAQRRGKKKNYKREVPDEAVDKCEKSHEAGNGKKPKADANVNDDTGIMALVCRHDIPLFLANIDSPGEHQKYAIALVEHLVSLLPPQATLAVFYDVGCVVDRSIKLYNILPVSVTERLLFATSAMHAFGHEWACQIIFNPRIRKGLGLTDGEGVERLWSRLRGLIGLTRHSGRERRIWLVDRQAGAIGSSLRDNLGDWICHRLLHGIQKQSREAEEKLKECGLEKNDLRQQWKEQQAAQLSLRAHAPARLKKELDAVLILQAEVDAIETAIEAVEAAIKESTKPASAPQSVLSGLQINHRKLQEEVESLYSSLNIPAAFPELNDIDYNFVTIMLKARDLKINIRKRAVGSFFEWERLDRAAGGRHQALGTRLHQQTRDAIKRRAPALMSAIKRFNGYCEQLKSLHQQEWMIPLPQPLPTKLHELKDDSDLMEDVWISASRQERPRWLENVEVRNGIQAVLKIDRCLEEQKRLGIEADNVCRWFGRELSAIELALQLNHNHLLFGRLRRQREHMLRMKGRWSNNLVSEFRFDCHVKTAEVTARLLSSNSMKAEFDWILPFTMTTPSDVDGISVIPGRTPSEQFSPNWMDPLVDRDLEVCASGIESNRDDSDGFNLLQASIKLDIQERYEILKLERLVETSSFFQSLVPLKIDIDEADMSRLADRTARLNDRCLNGCARYLELLLISNFHYDVNWAIFSTHDLVRIRHSVADEDLWRHLCPNSYWEKDIWIIPIHRESNGGHWVLCVAQIQTRKLLLFDSLAQRTGWDEDTQTVMKLITRIMDIAHKRGRAPTVINGLWTTQHAFTEAKQSNSYDCGLWVIASMFSAMRGFDATGLVEADMPAFRVMLHRLMSISVIGRVGG